jgi:Family of unknown function (DUF6510)
MSEQHPPPSEPDDFRWSDGNALGGPLSELLAVDITVTTGQCAHCDRTAVLAQAVTFASAHGIVARCPGCDAVLLRVVRGPDKAWLDARGLRYLEFPLEA